MNLLPGEVFLPEPSGPKCTVCGLPSPEGADEEGDGGYWCLACIKKWEAAHGCHWEDGTPLKP